MHAQQHAQGYTSQRAADLQLQLHASTLGCVHARHRMGRLQPLRAGAPHAVHTNLQVSSSSCAAEVRL